MPKATVSQETERHDLQTCPGGYVELRQLSYYEMMHRRDIAAKLYTEQKVQRRGQPRDRQGRKSEPETMRAQLEVLNVAIMEYEFAKSIVNHNLEDDDGHLLDFTNPLAFHRLDPKIGQEIGRYIDDLNQEEEEDLDPFKPAPSSSSQGGETKPENDLEMD